MARVIIFSRTYPKYHPKANKPTFFVEKFYNSVYGEFDWSEALRDENGYLLPFDIGVREFKHTTIRQGHRWKIGDKFSPRVWSGVPYKSKQIIIADDIEVKKTWHFEKDLISDDFHLDGKTITDIRFSEIANNDGLSGVDLYHWFNKPFQGQIICWNENIEY